MGNTVAVLENTLGVGGQVIVYINKTPAGKEVWGQKPGVGFRRAWILTLISPLPSRGQSDHVPENSVIQNLIDKGVG